jgi:hypothetical protein
MQAYDAITDERRREWARLQMRYIDSAHACDIERTNLDAQYQTARNAPAFKRNRLDALRRKVDRASEACYGWLLVHSPWDWTSGVNVSWTCRILSADVAMSEARPVLPRESMCYGSTAPAQLTRVADAQDTE